MGTSTIPGGGRGLSRPLLAGILMLFVSACTANSDQTSEQSRPTTPVDPADGALVSILNTGSGRLLTASPVGGDRAEGRNDLVEVVSDWPVESDLATLGWTQQWRLSTTADGRWELASRDPWGPVRALTPSSDREDALVLAEDSRSNGAWNVAPTQYTRLFALRRPTENRCLTDMGAGEAPRLRPCGADDAAQQWSFRVMRADGSGTVGAGVSRATGFWRLPTYALLLLGLVAGGATAGLWLRKRPRRPPVTRSSYAGSVPQGLGPATAWRPRELEAIRSEAIRRWSTDFTDDDRDDPRWRGRHRAPRQDLASELARFTTPPADLRRSWAAARQEISSALSRLRAWPKGRRLPGWPERPGLPGFSQSLHSCQAPLGLQHGRIVLAELGAGKGLISVSGDQACARRLVATLANEVASGRWGPETTVVAAELSADELDLDHHRVRVLRDVRDVPTAAAGGPLEREFGALALMLGRPSRSDHGSAARPRRRRLGRPPGCGRRGQCARRATPVVGVVRRLAARRRQ